MLSSIFSPLISLYLSNKKKIGLKLQRHIWILYLLVAGPCWQYYYRFLCLFALWKPAKSRQTVRGVEKTHSKQTNRQKKQLLCVLQDLCKHATAHIHTAIWCSHVSASRANRLEATGRSRRRRKCKDKSTSQEVTSGVCLSSPNHFNPLMSSERRSLRQTPPRLWSAASQNKKNDNFSAVV